MLVASTDNIDPQTPLGHGEAISHPSQHKEREEGI
jgi:hypothetical protein